MLIGIVSDNHRLIDPALAAVLAGVQEIWHAGDLVTFDILPVLKRWAPVVAVRGNNDLSPELRDLPDEQVVTREGHRVLLRHIVGPPAHVDRSARQSIARVRPALVVMGHSHRPLAEASEGVVYLNPGSCGPRRFSLPRAAARLELTSTSARFAVVDLESRRPILEREFTLSP